MQKNKNIIGNFLKKKFAIMNFILLDKIHATNNAILCETNTLNDLGIGNNNKILILIKQKRIIDEPRFAP